MKAQDDAKGWPEGWLVAAAAGVLSGVVVRLVGEVGLFAAFLIAVFVFLVFGVLLGMFWGAPVSATQVVHGTQAHGNSQAHGAQAHGNSQVHGHRHAQPSAPVVPVSAGLSEHGALEVLGADPVAPVEAPMRGAVPEAVAVPIPLAAETVITPPAPPAEAEPVMVKPALPAVAEAVALQPAAFVLAEAGVKPQGLTAPRGGVADRLQTIEGIGPVMEKLCHELGIYHFDQIAGWGPAEVAWMDGNLKGFKGRVTRDRWVRQAALIGEVGVDEFLRRAKSNAY